MAEDWLADVKKYVSDVDDKVVAAIVRYCGIALQNKDSSLVSFSDPKETARVRENYLKKKLALTDDDATLDAAIASVGERMKGDPTKNRVTVYYLLAEHFGLLNIFGGIGKAGAAAAAGAASVAASARDALDGDDDRASVAPAAAVGAGAAGLGAAAAAAEPVRVADTTTSTTSDDGGYAAYDDGDTGGGMGWLPWLLLGALLLAALLFGLKNCSGREAAVVGDNVAVSETIDANMTMDGNMAMDANVTEPVAAVPEGAGVVAAERDAKPMLTVYFDVAKSEVHNTLATEAAAVKAYLDANPNATLAVSGFNDPTGNAAANAELSKNRAQNVKAALEKLGIAADRVVLEKPAETSGTGTTNAESRRVEVVVKG